MSVAQTLCHSCQLMSSLILVYPRQPDSLQFTLKTDFTIQFCSYSGRVAHFFCYWYTKGHVSSGIVIAYNHLTSVQFQPKHNHSQYMQGEKYAGHQHYTIG